MLRKYLIVLLTPLLLATACDQSPPASTPTPSETHATASTDTATPAPTESPTEAPSPSLQAALWTGESEEILFQLYIEPPPDPAGDPWSITTGDVRLRCVPTATPTGWALAECRGLASGFELHLNVPARAGDPILLELTNFAAGAAATIETTLNRVPPDIGPSSSPNVLLEWSIEETYDGRFTDIWSDDGVVFSPEKDGFITLLDAASGEWLSDIDAYDEPAANREFDPKIVDVKARDGFLYAATASQGVLIYDVRDPLNPERIAQYLIVADPESPESFWDIHNVYLSPNQDILYAINTSKPAQDLRLLDISDPANPAEVGRYQLDTEIPDATPHDIHVVIRDGRQIAFLNYWDAGLRILDATDPTDIRELGAWPSPGGPSHSGWAFEVDQGYYYAHNSEGPDQHLTVLDVTDLTAPVAISKFSSRDSISIHNVEVYDGIAYLAYYIDGLRVLDLRDPQNPVEIGHFDTVPTEDEDRLFRGAWGVHVDGEYVYVSDMQAGALAFSVIIPEP